MAEQLFRALVALPTSVTSFIAFVTLLILVDSPERRAELLPYLGLLSAIVVAGIAGGVVLLIGDLTGNRWLGWVALLCGSLQLGLAVHPTVFLATAHLFGPPAIVLIACAIWSLRKAPQSIRVHSLW